MTFLSDIIASTRIEVSKRQASRPLVDLEAELSRRRDGRRFLGALQRPGVAIIAEFKRASPSEGRLGRSPDLAATVQAYERGGAAAISVLTEATKFGGSFDDLRTARAACGLPILCKDFIVDEYQVYEAAEAGADAILLIVAAFQKPQALRRLRDLARQLSLDVLVEVRRENELETALDLGADLVGINNRDLDALATDLNATRRLATQIPAGITVVSESGLANPGQLVELARRVDAALIGTALMRAVDPEATCRELCEATASLEPAGRSPAFV